MIPGSGRSTGKGIGYPLQYSWVSLVAQLIKNLPAMQETWVQSLGREDPLEKEKATHSSILAWRIPWTSGKELDTTEQLSLFTFTFLKALTHTCRRRQWHPTPVLLPGKSHGRMSLVGCSPWGRD